MGKNNRVAMNDVPVKFGGVSIGEKTARIGISVSREYLNLEQADKLFTDRRLNGAVVLGHSDDAEGQIKLWDDSDHQLQTSFDIKGFRVGSEHFSAGLTMALKEINIVELARFSKGIGRFAIYDVTDIPEEEATPAGHQPGELKIEGPWEACPIEDVFDLDTPMGKVVGEHFDTLGELCDCIKASQLTKKKGIGPAMVSKIDDHLIHFWADNPQFADEEARELASTT